MPEDTKTFEDPQVAEAWELAQYLMEYNGGRNEKWQRLDRLYFHDEDPHSGSHHSPDHTDPLGMTSTSSGQVEKVTVAKGKASGEVDLGVDMLAALSPVVSVPAASVKAEDVEAADAREEYLNAYLVQAEKLARQGLVKRLAFNGFQRDMIVARVIPRIDRLRDRKTGEQADDPDPEDRRPPSEKQAPREMGDLPPVQLQPRDSLTVYPEWSEDGLAAVVEEAERTIRDIRQRHGDTVLPDHEDQRTKVKWLEVWDAEAVIYFADGEHVATEKHNLGVVPYAIQYPKLAESPDPARQVRPFLEDAEELVKRINRLLSIQETTAVQYNNDAWYVGSKVKHAASGSSELRPGLNLGPNMINYGDPDAAPQGIRRGGTPPDTAALFQFFVSEWELATWPREMHGNERLAKSGYAWGLMTEAGRVKLAPVLAAMEQVLEQCAGLVLRCLEREIGPLVGYKVHVDVVESQEQTGGKARKVRQRVELDTESIDGDYTAEVTLGQPDSASMLQKSLMAQRLHQSGLLSRQTVQEKYLGVQAPSEERERLAEELAEQSPEVQQMRAALAKVRELRRLRELVEGMDLTPEELALVPQLAPPEPPPQPPPDQLAEPGPEGQIAPPTMGGDFGAFGPGGPEPELPQLEEFMGAPEGMGGQF